MNKVEELNKFISKKSIFFPSAEIYSNNFAGFYEYGPIGNRIRLNLIDFWRKEFVQKNNFLEISGSIILPKCVFESSGHLGSFDDPIMTCDKCNSKYKLDKLLSNKLDTEVPENLNQEDYEKLIEENNIVCENCGGKLKDFKRFNLMSSIVVGADEGNIAYLRGETCQSIFLDFLRIYKTSRQDLPMVISQHGKVYRNEIAPRNGLLRCREFEQLETEMFFDPDTLNSKDLSSFSDYKIRFYLLKDKVEKDYAIKDIDENIVCGSLITYYIIKVQEFLENLGFNHNNLRFREVPKDDRAFYSKQTFDLEILCNNKWIELFSVNYRGDYDLISHSKGSKKDLSVKENGKQIKPHVLEVCSIGLDRLFYILLENSFNIKKIDDSYRNILKLKSKIAPYFVGVCPLVKKDGLLELGKDLKNDLEDSYLFSVYFDEKGSIGKRYARLDEMGVPYCLTLDYQTKEDNTVTIRDRDTFEQKRVAIKDLSKVLKDLYLEKVNFSQI